MRDRYHQIVALSRDCIKEIDLDGRITSVNVNGLAGIGASSADHVIARPWRELWPSEAAEMVDAAMAESAKGTVQEFEASCVNLAGVRQTWHVVTSPLFDERGKVEAIQAVSKNVSDRRALEADFHTLDSILAAERALSTSAMMLARARETSLATELHSLRGSDIPPSLSSTSVWSPIPDPEEIGREEAFFRRADHRLPARSRGRHADQRPVPTAWLQ
ncbi:histidine kinase-response regulator hybrid protein [Xanthomonas oryzae pv. oryzicola]|nr:histidine kinase-response regulator hybrid protein [Xanthomonas oryzae pv. oryzicola]